MAEGLVRLSVGLEDLDDLLADIGQALDLAHAMALKSAPSVQAEAGRSCSAPA